LKKIVLCVPNFSEGRRKEVVDAIASEIKSENVKLLDVEMDADHNRSVITFVGEPLHVRAAILKAAGKAAELINMEEHRARASAFPCIFTRMRPQDRTEGTSLT
jgi:glutamate formiminotransferase